MEDDLDLDIENNQEVEITSGFTKRFRDELQKGIERNDSIKVV